MYTILADIGPAGIDYWTWMIWAMIGIVGALFSDKIFRAPRFIIVDLLMGMCGAMLGGYLSVRYMGDSGPQQFIISVLSAVFFAWLLLWIIGVVVSKIYSDKNSD